MKMLEMNFADFKKEFKDPKTVIFIKHCTS